MVNRTIKEIENENLFERSELGGLGACPHERERNSMEDGC